MLALVLLLGCGYFAFAPRGCDELALGSSTHPSYGATGDPKQQQARRSDMRLVSMCCFVMLVLCIVTYFVLFVRATPKSGGKVQDCDTCEVGTDTKGGQIHTLMSYLTLAGVNVTKDVAKTVKMMSCSDTMFVTVDEGHNLKDRDFLMDMEPYCYIGAGGTTKRTTDESGANPSWDETFEFAGMSSADKLRIDCWDRDVLWDDYIGSATIATDKFLARVAENPDYQMAQSFELHDDEGAAAGSVFLRARCAARLPDAYLADFLAAGGKKTLRSGNHSKTKGGQPPVVSQQSESPMFDMSPEQMKKFVAAEAKPKPDGGTPQRPNPGAEQQPAVTVVQYHNSTTACMEGEYDASPLGSRIHSCAKLTPPCAKALYQKAQPTRSSDRKCAPVTVCSPLREYETKAPTNQTDRTCKLTAICSAHEYQTETPTATSDRSCAKLSVCNTKPGPVQQYQAVGVKVVYIPVPGWEENTEGEFSYSKSPNKRTPYCFCVSTHAQAVCP